MKYLRAIRTFLRMWGNLNWYSHEPITPWQWVYAARVSPRTAWEIARIFHLEKDSHEKA